MSAASAEPLPSSPAILPTPPAPPDEPAAAASPGRGVRLAYGATAFGENLALNSINQLAFAVFNLTLLVSPTLVGIALALPRLIDLFLDPLIGGWSDRLRSRWGRRRPFILVGALLCAAVATGLWFFPAGRTPTFYFWWLTAGSVAMAVAYSVLIVPYGALGLELISDYHERTRLMGTRSLLHKAAGVVNQWLLKWVQVAGGGNLVAGGRLCAPLIGATIAGLGLLTVWKTPERTAPIPAPGPRRVPLIESWRLTLGRPDFLRLCLVQVLIVASLLVIDNTGFYLNVFYVNGGDLGAGAWMKGWYGTALQAGGMLAIPGIVQLSHRCGKKRTLLLCTLLLGVGGIAKWFCYVPGAGWWLLLPSALMAPGQVAVLVLIPSMTADVCDLDEAESGARREGMFNAVLAWAIKLALSGSILLSGWVLSLTGWVTDLQAEQPAATFLAMRLAFAGGTVLFAGLAAWLIAGYGVTEAAVAASRRIVAQRARDAAAPA
jgi:GPH family glycoside/pentoside/hexuronide:cation symporter